MNYKVTLVESEEGWAVWCDDLPGCCSQGSTHAEAVQNIQDAIKEYLDARHLEQSAAFGKDVIHHEFVTV